MKEESQGSWRVGEEPLQNYPLLTSQFQGLQQQRELLAEAHSHHFKIKKIPEQGNILLVSITLWANSWAAVGCSLAEALAQEKMWRKERDNWVLKERSFWKCRSGSGTGVLLTRAVGRRGRISRELRQESYWGGFFLFACFVFTVLLDGEDESRLLRVSLCMVGLYKFPVTSISDHKLSDSKW